MKTVNILIISVILLMVSCCGKAHESEEGDSVLYESFIQGYIFADDMTFAEPYEGSLTLYLSGDYVKYTFPVLTERYAGLSEKYGDTGYEFYTNIPNLNQAIANDFTSIDIRSDQDFDEAHKAGDSLADIVSLLSVSPAKFIESGYTDVYDWKLNPIGYKILGDRFKLYGYWPVNKLLSELTPKDLLLLSPDISLKFETFPQWEKTHTMTVTFKSAHEQLSAKTVMTFP